MSHVPPKYLSFSSIVRISRILLIEFHTLFQFQSLTTLRDVPDSEFKFLGSLTNLESLEIGDCENWEPEVLLSRYRF